MIRRVLRSGVVLVAAAGLAACGAAGAVQKAQGELELARDAGAETKAPYEYYSAEAFLRLAVHEQEEHDKAGAVQFADKSMEYSKEALRKAQEGTP